MLCSSGLLDLYEVLICWDALCIQLLLVTASQINHTLSPAGLASGLTGAAQRGDIIRVCAGICSDGRGSGPVPVRSRECGVTSCSDGIRTRQAKASFELAQSSRLPGP